MPPPLPENVTNRKGIFFSGSITNLNKDLLRPNDLLEWWGYSRSVIWNLAKLLVNILQKVQRPPSNGDNGWTFVFSFTFGIHVLGKLMEWDYWCNVAICCDKHLRHDTKGIRFLTLHMCFFPCKGGHNISLLIVVFRVASPPKNSVRSLGRALDNRVTRVKGFVKTGRRFRRLRGEFSSFFLWKIYGKTSQSTEIAKHHAFFLIIFLQLRFVTLGFYHDQMFRAVFKALEAGPALAEGTTTGVQLYLQCRGRMLLQCLVILCPSLGVMVLLMLGCWFSIWKGLLLDF